MGAKDSSALEEVRDGVVRLNPHLEKCKECGKVASQIVHHTCTQNQCMSGRVRSSERQELAEVDDRDMEEHVLVLQHGTNSGSYAYHEIGADNSPICGGGFADVAHFRKTIRREAQDRGRSPCKNCSRIIHQTENE